MDTLEIIFATRNKAYGAYQLRRAYGSHLGRALGWGLGLVLLAIFLPRWLAASGVLTTAPMVEEFKLTKVELPVEAPAPELPPPVEPPKPMRSTVVFVPPLVLEDDRVRQETPPADIEVLLQTDADIAAVAATGDPNALPQLTDPVELSDIGDGAPAAPPVEQTYESFDVQVMPRFGNGDEELLAYLAKNIRYPDLARENNIQGSVVLAFVVDKEGQVRDVTVVKDIGGGCGKEAVRVVQGMPRWRPGEANGNFVKVRFTLPVRFKLQ